MIKEKRMKHEMFENLLKYTIHGCYMKTPYQFKWLSANIVELFLEPVKYKLPVSFMPRMGFGYSLKDLYLTVTTEDIFSGTWNRYHHNYVINNART